jgi:6-phosphogluconolactonase
MQVDLTVYADANALARGAASWLVERLSSGDGELAVALSGGSTPKRLYELLGDSEHRDRVPWQRVHWFWGDERFVPPDDPRSNFALFEAAVRPHAPIPESNVHPIPTLGLTPDEAATAYSGQLQRFYSELRSGDDPLFDVVLLGLGEDGHIASLFPGSRALEEEDTWAVAVNATGPEPRITLTYPALESCRDCLFLVAGHAKREVLSAILSGDDLPATRLETQGRCAWFVDNAAAPEATSA